MSTHILSALSRAPAGDVIGLAEAVLAHIPDVQVIRCRTGIVMLPFRDTAKGVTFHLGEVLMAEAHVRISAPAGATVEGYGASLGRDRQHVLAMAVLDASLRAGIQVECIEAFVARIREDQRAQDAALQAKVEATRVEMETF